MLHIGIYSSGLEIAVMNPQQLAAIQKILDELQAARNAVEGWRDHLIDPREALSGLTNSSGEVIIGNADTWNKALEYLETVENAQPTQPSPAPVDPGPLPADASPNTVSAPDLAPGTQSPTS